MRALAAFPQSVPVFRLLLPFATGIWVYDQYGPLLSRYELLAVLIAGFGLLLYLNRRASRQPGWRQPIFILQQLLLCLSGWSCCWLHDAERLIPQRNGRPLQFPACMAVVTADPRDRNDASILQLDVIRGYDSSGHSSALRFRAQVYVTADSSMAQLHSGDTLLLPGYWQAIKNRGNPFEFDYATYCRRRRISARQYLNGRSLRVWQKAGSEPLTLRLHHFCMDKLAVFIPDTQAAGLLQAMLAGDEAAIDPALRQVYADTGIIHAVSISGSHVNLLFLLIAFLFRPLGKRYQWLSVSISLVPVWFYVLMAGAAPAAIRAAIMFSIAAGGILLKRSASPLSTCCNAAFLMLLYEPMWLFSTGFQLSFVALLSIIIFYRPIRRLWQPRHQLLRWLADGLALSLAAELLTAPLVAYYFHSFPLMFLPANVLVSLVMLLIMLCGILLLLCSGIPVLAAMLGTCCAYIITAFHHCLLFLQAASPHSFNHIHLQLPELLCIYLLVTGIGLFWLQQNRTGLRLAAAALLGWSSCSLYFAWQTARQKILIVYQQSRQPVTELILGNTYLTTDFRERSSTAAAHRGFHCYRGYALQRRLLLIGTKKVLLLRNGDPVVPTACSILIVDGSGLGAAASYLEQTRPELVVLSCTPRGRERRQWLEKCLQLGLPIHDVRQDGAFLLRSN